MSTPNPPFPVVDRPSGLGRHRFVETLRHQMAQWERARRPQQATVSTGIRAIDQLLPAGGFYRGSLVEWLAAGEGSGATSLALLAAREAARHGGALLVLDPAREFYPPAAVRLGIDPASLIVVQAARQADYTWALDQALRCPGVAAVLAWPERLAPLIFRRLQLAAEQGGTLGLLVRPEPLRREPSWADVRLVVEPLPTSSPGRTRRLKVQLLRARGGASGRSVEVQLDEQTRLVHLAPPLAPPAPGCCPAGA
ncbi:MAG: ImuA family protein [Thermoguttaceae bacterium]